MRCAPCPKTSPVFLGLDSQRQPYQALFGPPKVAEQVDCRLRARLHQSHRDGTPHCAPEQDETTDARHVGGFLYLHMRQEQPAIDRAEDRERFQQMIQRLGLLQPDNATVRSQEEAVRAAEKIGYPLVVRPFYVLGGRAMEIVHKEDELKRYMNEAVQVSNDSPVLLDRFLSNAIEVDIDAVCDGEEVVIGAIMQHIEQAGVHSGDSACSLPPYDLPQDVQDAMRDQVKRMALELGVIGLMNVQFAVKDNEIYMIEVNPRAARTVPFVSKATGVPLAKIAAWVAIVWGAWTVWKREED